MDRSTPVRKPHTSTADLLTWTEVPPYDSLPPLPVPPLLLIRYLLNPSDGISKVVFGGHVTDEEVESLNKRKPCSGYKMKEMTGSGIFAVNGENDEAEAANAIPNNRTGIRMYQQVIAGISHISFGEEDSVSPKKPTTLPEVAKQRELSGNLENEAEAKLQKQSSDAKCKELSGHDIFAPPPENLPRPTTVRALALKESIELGERDPAGGNTPSEEPLKTAKKIYDKKFSELSGNNIFKGDVPPSSAEKPLSTAKLREISGNDIFVDGKGRAPRLSRWGVQAPRRREHNCFGVTC